MDGAARTSTGRGFQRMIDDIEDGKINCVVTKDLSRLGRNYILTGQYTEIYFPSKGVRYIAINDKCGHPQRRKRACPIPEYPERDARPPDQQKRSRPPCGHGLQTAHTTEPTPRWVISKTRIRPGIFWLTRKQGGLSKRSLTLPSWQKGRPASHGFWWEAKVPTPGWLNFQRYGTFANIYAGAPEEKAYAWTIAQVKSILKEETYIGHSVHNKQSNISFKNKKKVRKPKEEWIRVENTHEALVSKDVFDRVQELIETRRRKQKDGTTQIFSGLVKCADCGWSLAFGMNNQNKKPYGHYHCSNYGQGTGHCTMHYIRYDILYTYVLARIQYWSYQAQMDEGRLLQKLLKAGDRERTASQKKQAAELNKAEKRQGRAGTACLPRCTKIGPLGASPSTTSICCPSGIRPSSRSWRKRSKS